MLFIEFLKCFKQDKQGNPIRLKRGKLYRFEFDDFEEFEHVYDELKQLQELEFAVITRTGSVSEMGTEPIEF